MRTLTHALPSTTPGRFHELTSLHFGPGGGLKATIQAGLHADEIPGMLVMQHLREQLTTLEAAGAIAGEVVLVPLANPIGLSQRLLHGPVGRFDLGSGENFNRHYPDLLDAACVSLELNRHLPTGEMVRAVRQDLVAACHALSALTELAGQRRVLLGLAVDADIVLDLHADTRSVLHLYTADPVWPQAEPLARLLGAELVLLAESSGGDPFDEACSMLWARMARRQPAGSAAQVPLACLAVTVELRGEAEVNDELARSDALAILSFLTWRGLLQGPRPQLPALKRPPSPLAGSMPVVAPHAGVLLMRCPAGTQLRFGDPVADLVEPVSGLHSTLYSPVDGYLYAHDARCYALAGDKVARIAGPQPMRLGNLLSP